MHCCRAWAPVKHKSSSQRLCPSCWIHGHELSHIILSYISTNLCYTVTHLSVFYIRSDKAYQRKNINASGLRFVHIIRWYLSSSAFTPPMAVEFSKTYWFSKNSGKLCPKQWANASQTLWHSAIWPVLRKIRQLLQPERLRLLKCTQDTCGISLKGGSI